MNSALLISIYQLLFTGNFSIPPYPTFSVQRLKNYFADNTSLQMSFLCMCLSLYPLNNTVLILWFRDFHHCLLNLANLRPLLALASGVYYGYLERKSLIIFSPTHSMFLKVMQPYNSQLPKMACENFISSFFLSFPRLLLCHLLYLPFIFPTPHHHPFFLISHNKNDSHLIFLPRT